MANGNLKSFNGKVANVIGYQSYGKDRLRGMPRRVRQTMGDKTKQPPVWQGSEDRRGAQTPASPVDP